MKPKVLFLCTGNSCRSQMAEGLPRHEAGDRYEVFSAGTRPSSVNTTAVDVMKEIGIDISRHSSKSVENMSSYEFDVVITVCDQARETCPIFPSKVSQFHWSFSDPDMAMGAREEIFQVFRLIRDQIRDKITRALTEGEL
ncbi:MAG: arsenate reductase ArsC [Desulfobacterales bacterium]|nr:arsenate reductase ArsC [Desulfobacterales bacterium]